MIKFYYDCNIQGDIYIFKFENCLKAIKIKPTST